MPRGLIATRAGLIGFSLAISLAGIGIAWASGFAVRDGSPDWTANAGAGNAAKAYDAATAWTNPAGMVRLEADEIDLAGTYVDPYTRFRGLDTAAAQMVSGRVPEDRRNGLDDAGLVNAFGVWGWSPDLKFGAALTEPFGSSVDYPTDSAVRYQGLVTSVVDAELQLSAAYRLTDKLSVGFGPVIDYFHTRLTRALDLGPGGQQPVAGFDGDDFSAGFDVGSLLQVSPTLRFGANYRSRIEHRISGSESVFIPTMLAVLSPATAAQLSGPSRRAQTSITLPDSIDVGGYWQVTPALALLAELQWTHWSLFNDLTVVRGGAPSTGTPQNWRNTMFASVGASYRVMEALLLQTGIGFDQSPVNGPGMRYAALPDNDRVILGAGFAYAVLRDLDLQFGYGHSFVAPGRVSSADTPNPGTLVGSVRSGADSFSVGMKAKF